MGKCLTFFRTKKGRKMKKRRRTRSSLSLQMRTSTRAQKAITLTKMRIFRALKKARKNFLKRDFLGKNLTREPKKKIEEQLFEEAVGVEKYLPNNK